MVERYDGRLEGDRTRSLHSYPENVTHSSISHRSVIYESQDRTSHYRNTILTVESSAPHCEARIGLRNLGTDFMQTKTKHEFV